jgi:hypothetical protein
MKQPIKEAIALEYGKNTTPVVTAKGDAELAQKEADYTKEQLQQADKMHPHEQHNASSEDEEYSQDAGDAEHIQQMFKNMIAALDKQRRDGNEKIEARAVLDRQACLAKAMEAIAQAKNRHAAELEETKVQVVKRMAKVSSTMTKSLFDYIADVEVVHKDTVAARKQAKMDSAAVANDVKTLQTCVEQVCANLEKRLQQITSNARPQGHSAALVPVDVQRSAQPALMLRPQLSRRFDADPIAQAKQPVA